MNKINSKYKNKKIVKSNSVYDYYKDTFDRYKVKKSNNKQNISYLIFDDNINDYDENIYGNSRKLHNKSLQNTFYIMNDVVY